MTWRARHFGIWFTMTSTVTLLDRPYRFIDQQSRGPFKEFLHDHIFEQREGDHCRMTDIVTLASPVFGFAVEPMILVPYLRRLIEKRNTSLVLAARALR